MNVNEQYEGLCIQTALAVLAWWQERDPEKVRRGEVVLVLGTIGPMRMAHAWVEFVNASGVWAVIDRLFSDGPLDRTTYNAVLVAETVHTIRHDELPADPLRMWNDFHDLCSRVCDTR